MRLPVLRAVPSLPAIVDCDGDPVDPRSPALDPRSSFLHGLWTASGSPSAILRLDPIQLGDIGERDPATTVTTPSARLETLVAVAFDRAGTMWIASADDSLLLGFAPAALSSSGSRVATTVISSTAGSLSGPAGLAFDSQHRLWVANSGNGTLVRFDPAQLAAGGARSPAVVLSGQGHPVSLAFDAAGALWVSDHQFHTIVTYGAAQLTASGSPPPLQVLTAANSLVNPDGLAFDAAGTLWVANTGAQNLLAFTPAQLAGIGPAAPHIVIDSRAGSLSAPVGLAFDGGGNLWVAGGAGVLAKFSRTRLRAGGAPTASARLEITGHTLFWSVAFWPRPGALRRPPGFATSA